jgi:sec-independent protein translocase protein TatB
VFDIGPAEFIGLGAVALIVFGPERLPALAARAGRFMRQARQVMTGAKRDLREQLGPEFPDVKLSDLNRRGLAAKLEAFAGEPDMEVDQVPRPLPATEDAHVHRDTT